MKFVFTGKYTNGATGITILGHRFEGREPTNVTGEDAVRLLRHPEFEEMDDVPVAVIAPEPTSAPKNKGGRPRKVVS